MSEPECIYVGNPESHYVSYGICKQIGPFQACTYAGIEAAGARYGHEGFHRLRFKKHGVGVIAISERTCFYFVKEGPPKFKFPSNHLTLGDPVNWSGGPVTILTTGHPRVTMGIVGFVMRPTIDGTVWVWWTGIAAAHRVHPSKLAFTAQPDVVTNMVRLPPPRTHHPAPTAPHAACIGMTRHGMAWQGRCLWKEHSGAEAPVTEVLTG